MRKVAGARCAFVVLTLAMVAAGGADKTVTNKEIGCEFIIPESWTVLEDTNHRVSAYASRRVNDTGEFSVELTKLSGPMTAKEYAASNIAEYRTRLLNYNVIDQGDEKICGHDAYRIVGSFDTFASGRAVKFTWHILIVGTRVYCISEMAPKQDYDLYAKDIDAIVKSFKLIEAK
ncbi:MAG TPA: hypothetical protein VKX17_18625 [Planctomycetota bacterium]|nr:hypothetical protein [Planctomycetota bacterium]